MGPLHKKGLGGLSPHHTPVSPHRQLGDVVPAILGGPLTGTTVLAPVM